MNTERGNVSVLMTSVVVVSVLACFALARLGAAATTKARANTAADAAALAAADVLATGASPYAGFCRGAACSPRRRCAFADVSLRGQQRRRHRRAR